MRSVLRSVKPYWVYCILEGLKKIEVGKDFPKADDWDRTVFLYCSKDRKSLNRIPVEYRAKYERLMGKIVGRFVCDREYDYKYSFFNEVYPFVWSEDFCLTQLSCRELERYGNGKTLYGWHISDLKIYDKPKELSEFNGLCKLDCACDECPYYNYVKSQCEGRTITRPPQSWFYVEAV